MEEGEGLKDVVRKGVRGESVGADVEAGLTDGLSAEAGRCDEEEDEEEEDGGRGDREGCLAVAEEGDRC